MTSSAEAHSDSYGSLRCTGNPANNTTKPDRLPTQDNQYATEMLNFTTQYMGAYMRLPMDKQPNTDYVQCEP